MKQTVSIKLTVGNPTHIRIMEVSKIGEQLVAVSKLGELNGPAPDVIAEASDFAQVETNSDHIQPVKHYVLKSKNSPTAFIGDNKAIKIINSEKEISEHLDEKTIIYKSNNKLGIHAKIKTDFSQHSVSAETVTLKI